MIQVSFIEMIQDSEKLIKGFTLSNGASQELILPPPQSKQPYKKLNYLKAHIIFIVCLNIHA
jgi:hypothetical protein